MILLLDNYDSFVHNLARYLEELGAEPVVVRSDATTVDAIRHDQPEAIILSPGPCTPQEAGISLDVIRNLGGAIPMLGVCLGHQAIGVAFGATLRRAHQPLHGQTSFITHQENGLFKGLANPFRAMRYHSLVIEEVSSPLRITAQCDDGTIMAIEHESLPIWGVQFHPESILTTGGHQMLANFLTLARVAHRTYEFREYQSLANSDDDFYQRPVGDDALAQP